MTVMKVGLHLLDKGSLKYFHHLLDTMKVTPVYQSIGLKSQPLSDSKVIKITLEAYQYYISLG